MQTLHRIIATLLLIAFVPAALVAGQMRLCIGADGHRAVEFAHFGHHPSGEHAQPFGLRDAKSLVQDMTARVADQASVLLDSDRCIDLPLVSGSLTASTSTAKVKCSSQAAPEGGAGLSPQATTTIGVASSIYRAAVRPGFDIADARLAALRTVVLLI